MCTYVQVPRIHIACAYKTHVHTCAHACTRQIYTRMCNTIHTCTHKHTTMLTYNLENIHAHKRTYIRTCTKLPRLTSPRAHIQSTWPRDTHAQHVADGPCTTSTHSATSHAPLAIMQPATMTAYTTHPCTCTCMRTLVQRLVTSISRA